MVIKSFTPSYVRGNLLIYTGNSMQGVMTRPSGHQKGNPDRTKNPPLVLEDPKKKRDLLRRYLRQKIMDSIHNMRVLNTNTSSYLKMTPKKCLQVAKKEKKQTYMQACL